MTQSQSPRRIARLRATVLVALLAVVMVPAAALPAPASAADDSDIPGVPLPGSVVTGRLGGAIYDRVYWVDVEPNRIILMSLTGDAGTDFDLYLFDSSAPSVYGGTGQVAASTGPTSTESISYPARSGGRYYIDVSGFSEAEGNFRLVVAIAADTSAPVAEVRLNGGAPATTDPTVRVSVIGTDDLSGVDVLQLSEDGQSWTEWLPYRPLILWTFADADGPKHIFARVRDASGNVSKVATSQIVLDRAAPTVVELTPDSGEVVDATSPILARFSEAIDPQTLSAGGFTIQDPTGKGVPASVAWDAASNTATLVPTQPLKPGSTYTASLGQLSDLAGNRLVPPGAWSFVVSDQPRYAVSLTASAPVVAVGASVSFAGTITPTPPVPLILERSLGGGAWTVVGGVSADAAGAFRASDRATGNALYRVRSAGPPAGADGASGPVRVLVRRGVSIVGHAPSAVKSGLVGRAARITVAVSPASPTVPITLTVARYDTARKAWRTIGTTTRTSVAGRATFTWRPTTKGSYYVRASTPSQTLFANAVSSTYRWIVR